jgi:hypothetical protein
MDKSTKSACRVKHLMEKDHQRVATLILLVSWGSRGSWVSEPFISRFMAGERDLRLETVDKIAAPLGLQFYKWGAK